MEHEHSCPRCSNPMTCHAPIVDNYDGVPAKLCILELEDDLSMCEDCEAQTRFDGDDDSALDASREL